MLFGSPQNLEVIAENRQASLEHIQGMKEVLSEAYQEEAEAQIAGLLKFAERHQAFLDRIIASRKAGDISGAERALTAKEGDVYINGARLIIDALSTTLQEKRSRYNNEVSFNVLRGSISFALLALVMMATIWIGYFITARTQRKNEELTELLAYEATHDALTGLPNRRYTYSHLNHAIELANRHKLRLALMVIDLDGFKAINDTHGHNAGDAVLQQVAQRFKQAPRVSDFIARTGGDEFVLIAENVGSTGSLQHLAQRLIECLTEPIALTDRSKIMVGCSIGIAIYPDHANDIEALFATADQAMYGAKESGKNRWQMPALACADTAATGD